MKSFFAYFLGLCLFLAACKSASPDPQPQPKPGDPGQTPTQTDPTVPTKSAAPGLGTSKQKPGGKLFSFPPGVTVVGRPTMRQEDLSLSKMLGSGELVRFCLDLANSTASPISVELPAGLVWISDDLTVQNGLEVKPVRFELPAKATTRVRLGTYCLNADRHEASHGDSYDPQPIILDLASMNNLFQLLSDKKINHGETTDELTYYQQQHIVQEGVWEVTETGKLLPETLQKLQKLPTK
ncbi:hypothetical protein [Larkinella terrae]|uniref:Uncharacterized protein n=1 Tax=Larkinella terrae TaxID=2025311 RepID=A0A7K0EHE0_9BACT|nr:hypothetical protein [Larkinella terrae]MRS61204.1 hypothetical protein [Larkinella terrae]